MVSVGVNDGFSTSQSVFYLRLSDLNGEEIWKNLFVPGDEPIRPDICVTSDSNIVVVIGDLDDSLGTTIFNTTFIKSDLSGNTLVTKTYHFVFQNAAWARGARIFELQDSQFVFTTSEHLVRLSSNLDIILMRNYLTGVIPAFSNPSATEFSIVQRQMINGADSIILTTYSSQLDSIYSRSFDISVYSYVSYLSDWYPGYMHGDLSGSIYFVSTDVSTFNSMAFLKLDSTLHPQWIEFLSGMDLLSADFDIDSSSVVFAGRRGIGNFHYEGFIYKFNLQGDSILFNSFPAVGGAYNDIKLYHVKIYNNFFYLSGFVNSDTSVQKSYIAVTDTSFSFPVFLDEPNSTSNDVLVFPNPATDRLVVFSTSGQSIQKLILYSVAGARMKEINLKGSHYCELNVDELSTGVYYLYVQTDKTMRVKSIVIN